MRASSSAAAAVGGRPVRRRPRVVVVPGFLNGAERYRALAAALAARGCEAVLAPVPASAWWPTLLGADFTAVLRAVDAAAREGGGDVHVVGHSAGGWLARLWLGSVPYAGTAYDGARRFGVRSLVTLGTPHNSLERYPFGRVPERRPPPEADGVSERARASSLAYCNELYPGAFEPGVAYVSVVGDAVSGSDDAFAAASYRAALGGEGDVRGDGVTPVDTAHLDGATNLVLPGVRHQPTDEPWYGSDDALDAWFPLLLEADARG